MHILFSERERIQELKPKIYKRDMWYDKDTNKMAKSNAENSEIRLKKSDIIKDKVGNIKYDRWKLKTLKEQNRNVIEKPELILKQFKNGGMIKI